MKTLSIEKFFAPSSELTQDLTQRMREHSLNDLMHSIESVEPLNPESSDEQEPWNDLLNINAEQNQTPKEIAADQRWLSEILYGYLARLSHTQTSPDDELYDAVEAIPEGMSTRLGLDDTIDLELLEQLASEFQHWLAACPGKKFVAGWGTIWVDPANPQRFGLTRFPTPVEQEDDLLKTSDAGKAFSAGAGSLARSFWALFDKR